MRVLLVTHDFPPSPIGGEGMVAGHLAKLLVAEGVELEVVAPNRPGAVLFDKAQPFVVHRVDAHGKTFLLRTLSFYYASSPVVRPYRGDIVYYFRPGVLRKEIPAVVHFHTTRFGEALGCFRSRAYLSGLLNLLFVPLDRVMARGASIVIAPTETMRTEIAKFSGLHQDAISVLKNPLAIDNWIGEKGVGRAKDAVKVLYLGRLDVRKGIFDLLKAFKRSSSYVDNLSLKIVGNGPMLGKLRSWVERNGCGEVVSFQQGVPADEVKRLYYSHDLVVVPSVYEPFGVVVAEALAAGIPVVSSDVCVDIGQIRFPRGDVKALSDAIIGAASAIRGGRNPVEDNARVLESLEQLREEVVVKKLLGLFSLALARFEQ